MKISSLVILGHSHSEGMMMSKARGTPGTATAVAHKGFSHSGHVVGSATFQYGHVMHSVTWVTSCLELLGQCRNRWWDIAVALPGSGYSHAQNPSLADAGENEISVLSGDGKTQPAMAQCLSINQCSCLISIYSQEITSSMTWKFDFLT